MNLFTRFIISFFALTIACNPASETKEKFPAAHWEKLGPGGGGATFIQTFSFQSPDNFIIRCDMTGSYITNNGGRSYGQVNFTNGASAFAYYPNDKNIIYIGASFLYRSTNAGKLWQKVFPKKEDITSESYFSDHASYSATIKDTSLYNNKNSISAFRGRSR